MAVFNRVTYANSNPKGGGDNRLNSIPAKAKHVNDLIDSLETGNNTIGGVAITPNGIATTILGLNPTWNQNFGAIDGGTVANVDDVLTQPNTALRLALALEKVAKQKAVVSAAQATQIFGGTGVVGTDFAIAAGATAIGANQTVKRYTGAVGSSVALTASTTDLASDTHKSLILFTGNTFTASQALTLQMHTNNEIDASSFEAFVNQGDAGPNELEREAATTDLHAKIILTASGATTTILAGSYIYFEAANDTDLMVAKMCILTSGGTIAVTTANN